MQWQRVQQQQRHLAGIEEHQPFERGVHETVAVQADAQHVHAKPRPRGDHVSEDRQQQHPPDPSPTRPTARYSSGVRRSSGPDHAGLKIAVTGGDRTAGGLPRGTAGSRFTVWTAP